jgi:outer membrane protein assembly factor BamB
LKEFAVSYELSRRVMLAGAAAGLVGGAMAVAGCGSATESGRPRTQVKTVKAGTPVWRATVPSGVIAASGAGGVLCVLAGKSGAFGLSVDDGSRVWTSADPSPAYLDCMSAGDSAVIFTNFVMIAAVDPVSGRRLWRYELPSFTGLPDNGNPVFACDDTTVYVAGMVMQAGGVRSYLFAIDAVAGTRRWAQYSSGLFDPLAAGDGIVCALAAESQEMVAFDARTGARAWTATGPQLPMPTRESIADGIVYGSVASPASQSGLVALDASTGKVAWTASTGGEVFATGTGTGTVYVTETSQPDANVPAGALLALDASTGRKRWTRGFPQGIPTGLQQAGGILLAYDATGHVYALDPSTGDIAWKYTGPAGDTLITAVPAAGSVCLVSLSGAVVALGV